MRVFEVDRKQEGITLAAMLRECVAGLSWGDARRHIHGRRARVNGVACVDDARRVRAGDRVELLSESARPLPRPADIQVVYEDEHLIVIDKPAGMECERRREQRGWSPEKRGRQATVVEALAQKDIHVHPVHRLDRDTSGLMVYAKSRAVQEKLIASIASHDMKRVYAAVAIGQVRSQTVHTWIVRDRGDGLRGSVPAPRDDAQEAITHIVAREAVSADYTLLECRLETGRTHQIRIHLAEMGHPLCGEKLYRKPTPPAEVIVDNSGAPRHALHSAKLELRHPVAGKLLRFAIPWPADMGNWLRGLRKA